MPSPAGASAATAGIGHRQPRIMVAERTRGTRIQVSTARAAAGRADPQDHASMLAGWAASDRAMQKSQTRSVHFRIYEDRAS
jgi:hypothetical protein